MKLALLAAGNDSADLQARIESLLAAEGVEVRRDLDHWPEPWEVVVVLVVLSPSALADPAIADFATEATRRGLPLVPVVEDLTTYDFGAVSTPALSARNAVGWQPDGQALLAAVRGYLGAEAFPERRKLFLSYRRQDGAAVAEVLYDHFWQHGYHPFQDIRDVEPGAVVQERIVQQIADKDFVLLIDTPLARTSRWVEAELVEALARRIPVRVLSVGQESRYPLVAAVEHLSWDGADPTMLARTRAFVARGIGLSASFDTRVQRVLAMAAQAKGLDLLKLGRRQLVLRRGRQRLVLEYEPASLTLERLHRAYEGYQRFRGVPCLLVSGEEPILEVTRAAVRWARGRAPLEVCTLVDLYSLLDRFFP